MNLRRLLKHVFTLPLQVRKVFSPRVCSSIEQAVVHSELQHRGEVRFVVEAALNAAQLLRGMTPRQRAVELFAHLGVWDTADNTGVLVYVLFAERKLEIVADRGIAACVSQDEWDAIARDMSAAFRSGAFEQGAIAGLQRVTGLLTVHFPAAEVDNPDELPNCVILL